MFDRPISVYSNAMEGDFIVLILICLWGLLMAGASYKLAGWMGLNQKWRRLSAVGGFVSLGAGVLVLLGRWAYKAFFIKEEEEEKKDDLD